MLIKSGPSPGAPNRSRTSVEKRNFHFVNNMNCIDSPSSFSKLKLQHNTTLGLSKTIFNVATKKPLWKLHYEFQQSKVNGSLDTKLGGNAMLVDAEHDFHPADSKSLRVGVENSIVCQLDNGEMALESGYA